jgi:hypothetical protein
MDDRRLNSLSCYIIGLRAARDVDIHRRLPCFPVQVEALKWADRPPKKVLQNARKVKICGINIFFASHRRVASSRIV